jgi:hypothetical protein
LEEIDISLKWNTKFPVAAKLENNQWIFKDDNAPVHQSIQTKLWKITMMSIVMIGHPNHQTLI